MTETSWLDGLKLPKMQQLLRWLNPLLVAGMLLAVLAAVPPAHADDDDDQVVSGYVLVRLRDGATRTDLERAIIGIEAEGEDDDDDDDGRAFIERIPGTNLYVVGTPAHLTEQAFVTRLAAVAQVQYAEADRFLADPSSLPFGRSEPAYASYSLDRLLERATLQQMISAGVTTDLYVSQPAYAQIGLTPQVESLATGRGVKVAVLDTGVNPQHPALYGRCAPGFNALQPGLASYDVADGVTNYAVGHGTMVAGLIRRVAPGAEIVPVRVMNGDGVGSGLSLIRGLFYAVASGARVVNVSLSSGTRLQTLDEIVGWAVARGVVIVSSAGNEGTRSPRWPAACPGVLGVASVSQNNTLSVFSNYGSHVAVCAPGESINGPFYTGGYVSWSGTSFAAPFVTGQAALILSRNVSQSGAMVRSRIRGTARGITTENPAVRTEIGSGLIQIEASLRATPRP